MSCTRSTARIGLRATGAMLVVMLGLGASACSSSSKQTSNQTAAPTIPATTPAGGSTTTFPVAGTSVPKDYKPGRTVPPAALTAITQYETTKGPPIGTWTITAVVPSTVDPTYVRFEVSPAKGHENEVQAGYGFAHDDGQKWTVTGFGSSEVGCPPGAPDNAVVPAPVLVGFALTCPPNAS